MTGPKCGPRRGRCQRSSPTAGAPLSSVRRVKPAPFDYEAPTTVDEAVSLLAQHGDDAKVLAGGQSLVPLLALRLTRFDHPVDVNRVAGLQGCSRENGTLVVRAGTRQRVMERDPEIATAAPLLARATPLIGHF